MAKEKVIVWLPDKEDICVSFARKKVGYMSAWVKIPRYNKQQLIHDNRSDKTFRGL